jgi:hypothetical protein
MRYLIRWFLITAAVTIAVAFVPSTAEAANKYSPQQACANESGTSASSWTVLGSNSTGGANPRTLSYYDSNLRQTISLARVYLLWNGGRGWNCTATMKVAYAGTANRTVAKLEIADYADPATDDGNFTWYAATYGYARGSCVRFTGGAIDRRGSMHYTTSGWGWCD